MTDYPLNWGWDPDSADKSDNPASSPATQPYPLEWGYHTDVKNDTAPAARLRAGSLQGDPSDALPPDQSPSASQMPTPVARSLNGWGDTYLDSRFAPRLDAFIQYAQARGVNPLFTSAYRSQSRQDYMRTHPVESGANFTPAEHSLHSAGLAVDVDFKNSGPETRKVLLEAARNAGLNWGGSYRDLNHFDYNPGGNPETLIRNFGEAIRNKRYFDIDWWRL